MFRCLVSLALFVGTAAATLSLADERPGGDKKAKTKEKGKAKGKAKADDGDSEKGDAGKPQWHALPPGMDPRVKEVMTDLRSQFNSLDVNVNWALEPDELAKGFRGANADVPEWAVRSPGSSTPAAQKPSVDDIKAKFPDQYFLSAYDLDRDDKVTKDEFVDSFMKPVAQHYRESFEKKDKIDAIALKLQAKGIDRAQRAKLAADMKILDANLHAGMAGFKHGLALDRLAAVNTQRRANWAWYNQFRR